MIRSESMIVKETGLLGLIVIEPIVFQDERGYFLETFRETRYREFGIYESFVQDNQSHSKGGVLRGLHFQAKQPQAQIVTVLSGTIFDVCVDIRKNSRTFGKWYGIELSEHGPRQIYMAAGFAHGYCVMSDEASLHYKVSSEYDDTDQCGIIWNDPDLGITWPKKDFIISFKDRNFPGIKEIS
jgi:dTDP-4-dehydrorhamnose 3,5-epimerase